MSCDRGYGLRGYPACSGNGQCIDGFCVCHQNWSSVGDLALEDGVDCDIHIPTIRFLNLVFVVVSLVPLVAESQVLYSAFVRKGRVNWKSKQVCHIFSFVSNVCGYFYAICKVVDPQRFVLSRTLSLTLVHILNVAAAFAMTTTYGVLVMTFIESYCSKLGDSNRKAVVKFKERWIPVVMLPPCFHLLAASVVMLVFIFAIDPKYSDSVNIAYACILLVDYGMTYLFMTSLCSMFIRLLEDFVNTRGDLNTSSTAASSAIDVDDLLKLIKRLYAHGSNFMRNGVILYVIILSWKFFRRKTSYYTPFQLIMMTANRYSFLRSLLSIGTVAAARNRAKFSRDGTSVLDWKKKWNEVGMSSIAWSSRHRISAVSPHHSLKSVKSIKVSPLNEEEEEQEELQLAQITAPAGSSQSILGRDEQVA